MGNRSTHRTGAVQQPARARDRHPRSGRETPFAANRFKSPHSPARDLRIRSPDNEIRSPTDHLPRKVLRVDVSTSHSVPRDGRTKRYGLSPSEETTRQPSKISRLPTRREPVVSLSQENSPRATTIPPRPCGSLTCSAGLIPSTGSRLEQPSITAQTRMKSRTFAIFTGATDRDHFHLSSEWE